MDPPLSVSLVDKVASEQKPVVLALSPDNIFTTAVGHTDKRTLASWHVTSPAEVIEHMLYLVNAADQKSNQ